MIDVMVQCCVRVAETGPVRDRHCWRWAVLERDGQAYCEDHAPAAVLKQERAA